MPTTSRRALLERVAIVVGLAGVADLVGLAPGLFSPAEGHPNVRGLYSQRQVNVCYAPMKVVRADREARRNAKDGVYLRKGPSFDAEPTLDPHNHEIVVERRKHVGRQSAPFASSGGCQAPAPRRPVNGFVWCYDYTTGKSGWAPTEVDGVEYVVDDPRYGLTGKTKHYAGGPRRKDFDCRAPRASQVALGHKCGGPELPALDFSDPRTMVVADFGTRLRSNKEDFYLRLSLDSTAFHWMAAGDRVVEMTRCQGYSYGRFGAIWSFVDIRRGRYTPAGTRGWMLQSGLRHA